MEWFYVAASRDATKELRQMRAASSARGDAAWNLGARLARMQPGAASSTEGVGELRPGRDEGVR